MNRFYLRAFVFLLLGIHFPKNASSLVLDTRIRSSLLFHSLDCLRPQIFTLFSDFSKSSDHDILENHHGENNANDDQDDGDDDYHDTSSHPSVSRELSDDASRNLFGRNTAWLEEATLDLLDEDLYPRGKLTEEDVETIVGLMAAWARRRSTKAALTVERLLKRVVDDMRANNPAAHVSTRFYIYAIEAWAKSGTDGSAQRAQHIHDAMVQMYNATNDPLIAPSSLSYNSVITAWSKSGEPDAARRADHVFMQMINASIKDDSSLKPDSQCFATVIRAHTACSNSRAVIKRCEEIFDMMEDLGVNRNCYTYSALQNIYARSGRPDAPERTKALLERMMERYEAGDVYARPNTMNFNDVLTACSRTPSQESAETAIEMLSKMETSVEQGGYDVEPDKLSYALTILACARCPDEMFAAKTAQNILEKLEARARVEALKRQEISSAAPPSVTLDLEPFNVVLTAVSKSRQHNAPEQALRIIERMKKYEAEGESALRPNLRSWNALLNAFARGAGRKDRDFARDSERVLESMFGDDRNAKGDRGVQPDAFTFAAVLNAHLRSKDPNSVQRADAIVRKMEEMYESGISRICPDVFHYTILASIWARSRSNLAPERCLQILVHMYERDKNGYPDVKPNVRTYNAVLDCLSRSMQEERAEQLLYHMLDRFRRGDHDAKPDSFSFNCVINAFTRSKQKGSGRRAEAILDRFLEFEEENPSVKPDTRSFTLIISYYGKSREMDAPYRAEYVLNRLILLYKSGHTQLVPNLFAIQTVMDSYAYANHPDAGRNAERLLKLIRDLRDNYNTPKLTENTAVMNSLLLSWANSGDENAGFRAEQHLLEMERSYRNGKSQLRPDTRSYGLVLSAWSKSRTPDKAKQALELFRRMEGQQSAGSDILVCEHAASLVINSCAFSNGTPDVEQDAFNIAESLFNEMLESPDRQPSSLTYGWFIQACGRLRVDEGRRGAAIEKAFTRCCHAGLLNEFILHRFKGATNEEQFWDLVGPHINNKMSGAKKKQRVALHHLPNSWRRNCT